MISTLLPMVPFVTIYAFLGKPIRPQIDSWETETNFKGRAYKAH